MLPYIHLKNDLKQIFRDPIMAILLVAPLLLITALKLMLVFLVPYITAHTTFHAQAYMHYVYVFAVMMCGAMLGIVTGFLMIDERDGKIAELMSVTPLGRAGYLLNRLLLAAILTLAYGILCYYALQVVTLPLMAIIFVAVLAANYATIIGLLIFAFADDKVKALSYAKAINALSLFAFADLIAIKWLGAVSHLFPPYGITMVVQAPHAWPVYLWVLCVNVCWLALLIRHYWQRES